MYGHYFNYSTHFADGRWAHHTFVRKWWSIYRNDPRWAPPSHRILLRSLQPGRSEHMDRLRPLLLRVDALRSSRQRSSASGGVGAIGLSGSIFEEPVAAVALLFDPRRNDGRVDLGLLHLVNDEEVGERLFGIIMEQVWQRGGRRIVGPTALSPRLGSGLLEDHFQSVPPLETPYNPPYVPELLHQSLQPLEHSRLFHMATADLTTPYATTGPAKIVPLQPMRLANDLLPLFQAAFSHQADAPTLDRAEAEFLLDWLQPWATEYWLALIDDAPVGFVSMRPNLSNAVRRANGGRNPLWYGWLQWRQRLPTNSGRLLTCAVAEDWRGQGIGRQLWQHALAIAHKRHWQEFTIGPIRDGCDATAFLTHVGATPRQQYTTYYLDL